VMRVPFLRLSREKTKIGDITNVKNKGLIWVRNIWMISFLWFAQLPVKVKIKLSLCLFLTKHQPIKMYWDSGGIDPHILELGTRWRWVVGFMPRLLYHQGKHPWYPFDRRLGGPQSQSGCGGEEKNSQPLLGLKPLVILPVLQTSTTCYSWVITTLTLHSEGPRFDFQPDVTILTEVFHDFLHAFRENAGIIFCNRLHPFPMMFLPVHHLQSPSHLTLYNLYNWESIIK
jgi:hypothetical protein